MDSVPVPVAVSVGVPDGVGDMEGVTDGVRVTGGVEVGEDPLEKEGVVDLLCEGVAEAVAEGDSVRVRDTVPEAVGETDGVIDSEGDDEEVEPLDDEGVKELL